MKTQSVELAVLVNGKPIPEYGHEGKTFVAGKLKSAYELQIKNNNGFRILVIPSVDGINALSGKPATADSDEGYVIPAYGKYVIDGWRQNLNEVAQFLFESKDSSYAAKGEVGSDQNCGVIGITCWREKEKPATPQPTVIHHVIERRPYWPYDYPYATYSCGVSGESGNLMFSSDSSGSAPGNMNNSLRTMSVNNVAPCSSKPEMKRGLISTPEPAELLGTGWGGVQESSVVEVEFERGIKLMTMELYYATFDALKQMGVEVDKSRARVALPSAFGGFCKPPKT